MKLAVITFKECWQEPGGRWVSSGGFSAQMSALASLFDETSLMVVSVEPREGGIPLPAGARVVSLKSMVSKGIWRKLGLVARLPYYLVNIIPVIHKADVVHSPIPGDLSLLGMLVAIISGKRLIARYGGSWEETAQTTLMNRFTKACMRRFAGGKHVMLATGNGDRPPAPGISWLFTTALSRSELEGIHPVYERSLSMPPHIVFAGRLSPEKGIDRLIEAVGRLKRSGFQPLPVIYVMGDGPERINLTNLCKERQLEDHFIFTGQLNRQELSDQMMAADFCIQPSLTEGFSKAWLDAMAHGLPVVASDVGAAGEVIGRHGERGWLVPPGNIEALCSQMEEIIKSPMDWPTLRKRCRAFVEQYTLEAWAEAIGQICAHQWGLRLVEGKLTV